MLSRIVELPNVSFYSNLAHIGWLVAHIIKSIVSPVQALTCSQVGKQAKEPLSPFCYQV